MLSHYEEADKLQNIFSSFFFLKESSKASKFYFAINEKNYKVVTPKC